MGLGPNRPHEDKDPRFLFVRPTIRGIPEIMVWRILMFMWSFGLLFGLGVLGAVALSSVVELLASYLLGGVHAVV